MYLTFGNIYSLFLSLCDFVGDIWSVLNTRISEIGYISIEGGILEWASNALLDALQSVFVSFFGDITLLEMLLGASILTLVGFYIVKFALSVIPVV